MSYLELLWIPAVLGWLPLIYADEIAEFRSRSRHRVDATDRVTSDDAKPNNDARCLGQGLGDR